MVEIVKGMALPPQKPDALPRGRLVNFATLAKALDKHLLEISALVDFLHDR
jgi:hypothetical protein